jgi:hypothetical protein
MSDTLHPQTVLVCGHCLDLKGQECHTPGCVFFLHSMDEAKDILDTLRIRMVIDGETVDLSNRVPVTPAPATPATCRCDTCFWWTPPARTVTKDGNQFGCCHWLNIDDEPDQDKIVIYPPQRENEQAWARTGPKFGGIHHRQKEALAQPQAGKEDK